MTAVPQEHGLLPRHHQGDSAAIELAGLIRDGNTAGRLVHWDHLRTFQAVVEAGNFSCAARALDLSQSAVSRRIGALETELSGAVFQRNPRGIQLTEIGEVLYRTVQGMSANLTMGLVQIDEVRSKPIGPLRITTSVAFGSAWLTPRMNRFLALYPDIAISLLLVDNIDVDLTLRQADIAIRFAPQTQPNLIERRIMAIRYHVFASRDYLSEHGTPESAEDLDRHRLIVFGEDTKAPVENMNWLLHAGGRLANPRSPTLRVNSVYGIYRAVQSGLGIGALPYYMSEESSDLVEVLPELEGPRIDAFFVYPEELRHSKRVTAVRDFLVQQVDEMTARRQARQDALVQVQGVG